MTDVTLRPMRPDDIEELVRITSDTGFFRRDEVAVAREVLLDSTRKCDDYHVHVAAGGERLLGYVCFGPTPLTHGTWDIYWLAVAPSHQGQGIGRRLVWLAEAEIQHRAGRLVIIETSSQELYEPTRRFHQSMGYQEVSRIPDFYDVGDAKLTFAKTLLHQGDPPLNS